MIGRIFGRSEEPKHKEKDKLIVNYMANPYSEQNGKLLTGHWFIVHNGRTYTEIDPGELFYIQHLMAQYRANALDNKADAMKSIKEVEFIKEKYHAQLRINSLVNNRNTQMAQTIRKLQETIDDIEQDLEYHHKELSKWETRPTITKEYLSDIESDNQQMKQEIKKLRRLIWDCNDNLRHRLHLLNCAKRRYEKSYIPGWLNRVKEEEEFLKELISKLSTNLV